MDREFLGSAASPSSVETFQAKSHMDSPWILMVEHNFN